MGKTESGTFETRIWRIERGMACAAGVCVFVMMVLVSADVILRYMFNRPIAGSFELVQYLMVALVLLGLAWTQAEGKHLRVEALVMYLKPRQRTIMNLLALLCALVFFGLVTGKGMELTWLSWQVGERCTGPVPYPVWPSKALIALGGFVLCVQYMVDIWREFKEPSNRSKATPEIST